LEIDGFFSALKLGHNRHQRREKEMRKRLKRANQGKGGINGKALPKRATPEKWGKWTYKQNMRTGMTIF